MANLIPLEQAAAILGISVERITELRSQNEIFGYRDGSSWKFKLTELERVADELDLKLNKKALEAAAQSGSESGLDFREGDPALNLIADDESSVDVMGGDSSEDDLIQEDSSVEIFAKPLGGVESALGLSDSGLNLEDSVDDLKLHDSGEVVTEEDEDLAFGSSDLSLAAESSKKLAGDDDVLDDFEDTGGSPSDTGKMLGDDDDMLLSEEDLFSDELSIADSGSFEDSAELSSDFEDSDLVMEDSDSSTEVVLEANESGINLSPNESGIALDDSLELGGSDIDSLELPEDDDDIIMLEDPADEDAITVMQEDDFNLTPLEDAMEDESTGSQVIALEDSEIYADESSATILAESNEMMGEPAMLEDSLGFDADAYGMGGLAPAGMPLPGGAAAMPEAPYTVWQVVSLGLVTVLLSLGVMLAYDMARNMWMPDDQVLNSGVLKLFLDLVGMG